MLRVIQIKQCSIQVSAEIFPTGLLQLEESLTQLWFCYFKRLGLFQLAKENSFSILRALRSVQHMLVVILQPWQTTQQLLVGFAKKSFVQLFPFL